MHSEGISTKDRKEAQLAAGCGLFASVSAAAFSLLSSFGPLLHLIDNEPALPLPVVQQFCFDREPSAAPSRPAFGAKALQSIALNKVLVDRSTASVVQPLMEQGKSAQSNLLQNFIRLVVAEEEQASKDDGSSPPHVKSSKSILADRAAMRTLHGPLLDGLASSEVTIPGPARTSVLAALKSSFNSAPRPVGLRLASEAARHAWARPTLRELLNFRNKLHRSFVVKWAVGEEDETKLVPSLEERKLARNILNTLVPIPDERLARFLVGEEIDVEWGEMQCRVMEAKGDGILRLLKLCEPAIDLDRVPVSFASVYPLLKTFLRDSACATRMVDEPLYTSWRVTLDTLRIMGCVVKHAFASQETDGSFMTGPESDEFVIRMALRKPDKSGKRPTEEEASLARKIIRQIASQSDQRLARLLMHHELDELRWVEMQFRLMEGGQQESMRLFQLCEPAFERHAATGSRAHMKTAAPLLNDFLQSTACAKRFVKWETFNDWLPFLHKEGKARSKVKTALAQRAKK